MVAPLSPCVVSPLDGQVIRRATLSTTLRKQRKAQKKRERRPPLSNDGYRRLRNKVLPVVCSDPWAEYAVKAADACGILPTSSTVVKSLRGLGIYPLDAHTSPMKPCRCDSCTTWDRDGRITCQRLWPAHYVNSRGYSYECSLEKSPLSFLMALPSSPGVVDMARLKATRKRKDK